MLEKHKEECFTKEYSIQKAFLEQIFNMLEKEQIIIKSIKKKKIKSLMLKRKKMAKKLNFVNGDLHMA